jgi:hypothetical protein
MISADRRWKKSPAASHNAHHIAGYNNAALIGFLCNRASLS